MNVNLRHLFRWLVLAGLLLDLAAGQQRPAAAYAPLFTGLVKLTDVPEIGAPAAPPIIAPTGRRRRHNNFPAAAELSAPVLQRLDPDVAGTGSNKRRRLLTQAQQQPDAGLAKEQQLTPAAALPPAAISKGRGRRAARRLQQQQQQQQQHRPGWSGLWWADAGGVGLAVSASHALHAVSTVLAVYSLDPATGAQVAARVVSLQDLFNPVGAANCKDGVYDAVPAFDKAAQRFLLTATCSGKGSVLLAVSATPDPTGSWFLYNLVADAAATGLECTSPPESALADSVRLNYDANGLFLSLFNYCPSDPAVRGATILALPKAKAYKGAPNFVYAVFSADQILAALPADSKEGMSPGSFRQCQPAPPQADKDAAAGAAFFVCDHIGPDSAAPRTSFTLVSILNTGALWQFAGARPTSPAPFLTATIVQRGAAAPVSSSVMLQQPEGGSPLHGGGTRPAGFWSGSAAFSRGRLFVVDRSDVSLPAVPPFAAATVPSLVWSEVQLQATLSGGGDCTKTSDWGSKWDFSRDWSQDWGKDFDLLWEESKADEAELAEQQARAAREAAAAAAAAAAQCAAAAANRSADAAAGSASVSSEISDGSAGTVNDTAAAAVANCTAALLLMNNTSSSGNASSSGSGSNSGGSDVGQSSAPLHRRKLAMSVYGAGMSGWDLGCWYCWSDGVAGYAYTSSWFYKYWYNQWDSSWYTRYKKNYAPGWFQPRKSIGRHLMQSSDGNTTGASGGPFVGDGQPPQSANESVVIPPCLQSGRSYKNTCKQCNNTGVRGGVAANVTRWGVLALGDGRNPIGFVAPSITVTLSGSIVVMTGYSGSQAHPSSEQLAYPGIGSWTIQPGSSNATWKVVRAGAGKVRSPSGRWSDFSSADVAITPTAATAGTTSSSTSSSSSSSSRLYFGVQWSQREVACDDSDVAAADAAAAALRAAVIRGTTTTQQQQQQQQQQGSGAAAAGAAVLYEFEPVCAMPGPWIGFLPAAAQQ